MRLIFSSFVSLAFLACSSQQKADLLIYNATVYTVDSSFSTAEAMVVSGGKVVATGKTADLQKQYDAKEKVDAEGKFIYPGLIDAHAHFFGYASSLATVDLVGTESWEEILQRLQAFEKDLSPNEWLIGRGWDQNDWAVKEFPSKEKLDELFPNRPVLLTRVDGHAAIVNQKALDLAGVKPGDKLTGGDIEVKNGKLTGVLIDNAIDVVYANIPGQSEADLRKALSLAEKNCFAVG